MNIRRRIIAMLVRVYPEAWRREYGAELTGVLRTTPMDARTIANVLWSGVRERAREAEMRALWRRAFVAFLVMEAFAGVSFARPSREFGGPLSVATFAMVMSAPYYLAALIGIIVPAAMVLKTTVFLGIVVAMAIIDRSGHVTFMEYVLHVLRMQQGTPIMLANLMIGSAIVIPPDRRQLPPELTRHAV
jgi:hypothetical protein